MSSTEFNEWQAYALLEPFGPLREDQRAGVIAATLVNVHLAKGSTPAKVADFFPEYEQKNKRKSWQEMLTIVELLNESLGGKDLRKNAS